MGLSLTHMTPSLQTICLMDGRLDVDNIQASHEKLTENTKLVTYFQVSTIKSTRPRKLKPWYTQIICHIIIINPRLGLCHFPKIFVCIFAHRTGRAVNENETPSASALRSIIIRLNILDLNDQRQFLKSLKEKKVVFLTALVQTPYNDDQES